MKKVISVIVGLSIVIGVFWRILSSDNLFLDSQTILKSPKVNISDIQQKANILNSKNNINNDAIVVKEKFTDFKNDRQNGQLIKKPFYIGVVGNSAITLKNEFNQHYIGYYHGYKYLINVVKQKNSSNSNYSIQLNEYFKGKLIGEYFLNNVGNDTYTGILLRYPNSKSQKKSVVGLTGSNSPFSV